MPTRDEEISPAVKWTLVSLSIVAVIAVVQGVVIWKIRQLKQKKEAEERAALGLELEDAKADFNYSNEATPKCKNQENPDFIGSGSKEATTLKLNSKHLIDENIKAKGDELLQGQADSPHGKRNGGKWLQHRNSSDCIADQHGHVVVGLPVSSEPEFDDLQTEEMKNP